MRTCKQSGRKPTLGGRGSVDGHHVPRQYGKWQRWIMSWVATRGSKSGCTKSATKATATSTRERTDYTVQLAKNYALKTTCNNKNTDVWTFTRASRRRLVTHRCGHVGVGILGVEDTAVSRVREAPKVRRVIGLTCSGTSQTKRIISRTEKKGGLEASREVCIRTLHMWGGCTVVGMHNKGGEQMVLSHHHLWLGNTMATGLPVER